MRLGFWIGYVHGNFVDLRFKQMQQVAVFHSHGVPWATRIAAPWRSLFSTIIFYGVLWLLGGVSLAIFAGSQRKPQLDGSHVAPVEVPAPLSPVMDLVEPPMIPSPPSFKELDSITSDIAQKLKELQGVVEINLAANSRALQIIEDISLNKNDSKFDELLILFQENLSNLDKKLELFDRLLLQYDEWNRKQRERLISSRSSYHNPVAIDQLVDLYLAKQKSINGVRNSIVDLKREADNSYNEIARSIALAKEFKLVNNYAMSIDIYKQMIARFGEHSENARNFLGAANRIVLN